MIYNFTVKQSTEIYKKLFSIETAAKGRMNVDNFCSPKNQRV